MSTTHKRALTLVATLGAVALYNLIEHGTREQLATLIGVCGGLAILGWLALVLRIMYDGWSESFQHWL